jgi:hypothetical protein
MNRHDTLLRGPCWRQIVKACNSFRVRHRY